MPLVLEEYLRLGVALLSILVFVVGFVAFWRRRTMRMGLVLALFAVFLAQGVLLIIEVLVVDTPFTESLYYAFQFVEVGLVALIILKR